MKLRKYSHAWHALKMMSEQAEFSCIGVLCRAYWKRPIVSIEQRAEVVATLETLESFGLVTGGYIQITESKNDRFFGITKDGHNALEESQ